MTQTANPDRRRFFRQLLDGANPNAPQRAAWHRVPEVGAGDGDVLWSGWAGDGEVFVVGDEAMVLHFDGHADAQNRLWKPMETPGNLPLHDVWGPSRDHLFAVGWMGCILHFDGTRWTQQYGGLVDDESQAFIACAENTPLFAIDGNASGHAWAVGDDGMILHYDGHAWQRETSPTYINLRAVACTPNGGVYAAGGEGTVLYRAPDGGWQALDCPLSSGFQAMLVVDDDTLLLGGGRYFVDQGGFRGELVRYANGRFQAIEVDTPMPRLRSLRPYKDGVLIVGDRGYLFYLRDFLTEARTAKPRLYQLESNCHHDLMDIVPLSTGEALVVGDFGTVMTAAPDFINVLAPAVSAASQKPRWEAMDSPTDRQLWNLWETPQGTCYACGEAGTVLRLAAGAERWELLPAPTELNLHCVWDAGEGGLYAAGQFGQIFRFDGSDWQLHFDLHLDITILSMWGTRPDSIFAVGDEGLILHFDGLGWNRLPSGTASALYHLWGMDDEHLLAVGDFGLVLRYNGREWTDFAAGTENFLYGVWGDALDNIYAVGLSGTLAHFNGQRWNLLPIRVRDDLLSITGSAAAGAYAVGTHGCALRLENGQWLSEPTGTELGLRSVLATRSGEVYAVGDQGTIMRRPVRSA